MTGEPVRWGVLGVADIAVRAVIPAIQRSRNGRVVAVASRTAERAQEAARRLRIPRAHGSYQALVDDPEVQAVYIPLPNSMHHEWTIRAAAAGKHVLCEKPLATTAQECREMIAACREGGVLLMEAFMYRFHPRTGRVAVLAARGAIGDLRMVRASFTFTLRDVRDDIRLKPELGGGALYDVGCYGINVSRMILGEPTDVWAGGHIGTTGVDEWAGAVLRFEGDRVALVDCSLRLALRQEYEIVGTDGRIVVPLAFLPGAREAEIHLTQEAEHQVERIPGADQYQRMVEHFGDAVIAGTPLQLPPEDAEANLRVIEALLRSLRAGEPQSLRA